MDNSDMQNSQKFISLFKKLEKLAATESGLSRETAFSKKLAKITKRNNTFRYYKEELQQFAKLRNAIVHDSVSDDKAIAEPHEEVIAHLKKIVEKIEKPAKVIPKFQSQIETVDAETPISVALDRLYNGDYSQLPVLENGKFIDLLTTDAIARWIAANKEEGGYLLEDNTVSKVLVYKEFKENYQFVSRETTLIHILEIFKEIEYKKHPVDAILITHGGEKEQKLMGIITHHDLPKIVGEIQI